MKNKNLLLAFWVTIVMTGTSWGTTFPPKPDAKHFYTDEAGLLTPTAGNEINKIAGVLWREQKIPLIVVTIRSLAEHAAADYTVERYAYELFNQWGIGSERRNYGMLLLVSAGDRRTRIELGAAWGMSANYQAQEIVSTLIVPAFKAGRYADGIVDGVKGMDSLSRGLQLPKPKQPWWAIPLMCGLLALAIGVIYSLFRNGHSGWGWALLAGLGALLAYLLFTMARNSRGSGGSFGGGSSGGGGATGSW